VKANQAGEDVHDVGIRREVGSNRRVERHGADIQEAEDALTAERQAGS
ncbi:unnamed protein product, partial [marine sediment metagenome]